MTPTTAIGILIGMFLVRLVLPLASFMLLGTWLTERRAV